MPAGSSRELELDLDAFEGPFDLLLTLVLRDELELARGRRRRRRRRVRRAPRRAGASSTSTPAASSSSSIAALLELKARALFPDEEAELAELEPEEAAEELARRLAEYRRVKEARRAGSPSGSPPTRDRFFRLGPAPLAPRAERALAPQAPGAARRRAARARRRAAGAVSTAHMALEFPPVAQFLERWRALLRRRSRFDFDQEVAGLAASRSRSRSWRCSSSRKARRDRDRAGGAVRPDQDFPTRRRKEPAVDRPLRLSRRRTRSSELARTIEALLVVALAAALGATSSPRPPTTTRRASRRRSSSSPSATARAAAGSCSSTSPAASRSAPRARRPRRARACSSGRSSAGSRRPRSRRSRSSPTSARARRPEIARIRGVNADAVVAGLVERGLIAEAGRDDEFGADPLPRRRRSSSASSGSSRSPRCRASTTSAPTPTRSASGSRRSPRSAPPEHALGTCWERRASVEQVWT